RLRGRRLDGVDLVGHTGAGDGSTQPSVVDGLRLYRDDLTAIADPSRELEREKAEVGADVDDRRPGRHERLERPEVSRLDEPLVACIRRSKRPFTERGGEETSRIDQPIGPDQARLKAAPHPGSASTLTPAPSGISARRPAASRGSDAPVVWFLNVYPRELTSCTRSSSSWPTSRRTYGAISMMMRGRKRPMVPAAPRSTEHSWPSTSSLINATDGTRADSTYASSDTAWAPTVLINRPRCSVWTRSCEVSGQLE